MTLADIWKLIEATKRGEPEDQVERLIDKVAKLDVGEVLSFADWWTKLHAKAYDWPLWGAAYLMNGGCSDDGFIDFRSWLLLQGEDVYAKALENPDSLAKVKVQSDEAQWECYPAVEAYRRATGLKDDDAFYNALEEKYGPRSQSAEPAGEQWDFDDEEEMQKRLPKLYKKFGDS